MKSATICARGLRVPPSACGDNDVHNPRCRRGKIVIGVVRSGAGLLSPAVPLRGRKRIHARCPERQRSSSQASS
jgi:hypothetical protein